MKVSPLFKAENGFLVRISDGMKIDTSSVAVVPVEKIVSGNATVSEPLIAVTLPWSAVELEPGIYNEELLSALRGYLKILEAKGTVSFIIPTADDDFSDSDAADSCIQAAVHSARRIKDCACVIGFAVVAEFLRGGSSSGSYMQRFIDEMNVKHSHYVYFADSAAVEQCGLDKERLKKQFVMYSLR